ncbi:MAG: class I SAM-dependent methyltransferase [Cycloclasticus sp.]|nr:class I SAM-dependent methyltransferase [Cycloclasticus sp.]
MDNSTIQAYNTEAKSIAALHATLKPSRIYELVSRYFISSGKTVDVGCGIGRDTDWLARQGYPVLGIDGSEGMLKQAQGLYPDRDFFVDLLPSLESLKVGTYQNILCSAVLMHLSQDDLLLACKRLVALMSDDGCLIISFRGTHELDNRERGKLYESIDVVALIQLFEVEGLQVVHAEEDLEAGRQLTWHNLVFKK